MQFFHTLRFRLMLGAFILVTGLFSIYSLFTIRFHATQMMDQVFASADRLSDVVKNATHYSMLLNRKEDVYQIIGLVGRQPGVEGIRIYNKRGVITYSTDSTEQGSVVDLHAEACTVCHDQAKPLESLPMNNRTRIYAGAQGHRVLGLINPIRNEHSCSQSGCHSDPSERTVLGVLDVRMSLEEIDRSVAREQDQMLMVSILAVIVMTGAAMIFLTVLVGRPVKVLIEGTRQIEAGNLEHEIPLPSRDEIGELARSFNDMTGALRREKEQNEKWAQTLEERVRQKSDELKRIHEQILQIEKMASLGKLSATVAHELNNPLEGILTYARLLAKQLRKTEKRGELQEEMLNDLGLIASEAARCGTIVKNLLLFSKKQVGELSLAPVGTIIDKAGKLMRHHFEISNVRFQTTLPAGELMLLCDENQIQQALVALFVNGVEAMPGGGTLTVEVPQPDETGMIRIHVMDTGVGIPDSDLPTIFDPFFSTKREGVGVGLGLSVVYGIVERHGGTIAVHSEVSKGTTFTLSFPTDAVPPARPLEGSSPNPRLVSGRNTE
ncbi:MAG: HAMP domain-containing protein [Ignavibacteriales bacterium]|nr:HAMP domain-containing protein [Ignavibacteriales bacterium]